MNIRMYDCGFGDCFKIVTDVNNPLIVDFGIHKGTKFNRRTIENRYDEILPNH